MAQTPLPLEPSIFTPPKIEYPRDMALGYVRKLLARGYDEKCAQMEVSYGDSDGGGLKGFKISHGKIFVPLIGPCRYEFRFKELAEEIRNPTSIGTNVTK